MKYLSLTPPYPTNAEILWHPGEPAWESEYEWVDLKTAKSEIVGFVSKIGGASRDATFQPK